MVKIVYSKCGGFNLSRKAILAWARKSKTKLYSNHISGDYYEYYLCPVDQYEKLYNEDCKKKNWAASNKLFFNANHRIKRHDPHLNAVIDKIGLKEAARGFCELVQIDVPKGTIFKINKLNDNSEVVDLLHPQDDDHWYMAGSNDTN